MERSQVFNFSAGPSVLPTPVLEQAAAELCNYRGSGLSVMEMSHRSQEFQDIFRAAKDGLRRALSVPETHVILFLLGGATLQFSMLPLNLTAGEDTADYAVTGHFAAAAAKEAGRFCHVNTAFSGAEEGYVRIPRQAELRLSPEAKYFYYCANNTIYGTAWDYVPQTPAVLCCDMSSEILSRPVDVSRYGVIFAGAQKNMAPAGLTVVLIDKALLGRRRPETPLMLDYDLLAKKDSMYNTPPCYDIYILSLVLEWLEQQGGVRGMEQLKRRRAAVVYDYLAESRVFRPIAAPGSRSDMNVTFRTESPETDAAFVRLAAERGLRNVKGHRVAGGMRASLYNAMPMEGAYKLVEVMKEFEVEHHV